MHENMNVQPIEYLCPKIAGTNLAYIEDDKQKTGCAAANHAHPFPPPLF